MNLIFVIIAMVIVIVFLVIKLSRKDSGNTKKLSETTAQNRALHQELANKQEIYSTQLHDANSQIDTFQKKEQQWISLEKALNRNIGQLNTLQKSQSERINGLENDKQRLQDENTNLFNTITALKKQERQYIATINGLEQDTQKLKDENKKITNIINTHKNSIPVIIKATQDKSDLLFFYREFIHTIVYYNPIHTAINGFVNNINEIDDNVSKKELAAKIGECLNKIDFSEIDKQIENYSQMIVQILYKPFYDIGEKGLGVHNVKKGDQFCKNVANRINEIMHAKEDINAIKSMHQLLVDNNGRWNRILSRSIFGNILRGLWSGIKMGIINNVYGENLGNIMNSWSNFTNLDDDDFVELYNHTIQQFIETSFLFARNLDIDFTSVEILFQEYQETEFALLQNKIQQSILLGENIDSMYYVWRTTQSNSLLNEISYVVKQIIEELQSKQLNEASISNITAMVCPNCLIEN